MIFNFWKVIVILVSGLVIFSSGICRDKPKIGLIFDDFGLHSPNHPLMQDFAAMECPFGAAIIPGLDYSTQLAELFYEFGKEVIVHMPMESVNGDAVREPLTLTIDMDVGDIRGFLYQAIFDVPNAAALSNHQGSKFTSDEAALSILASVLADTDLYFFDSVTVPRSKAFTICSEAGVISSKRDVFLDVDFENGEDIESRFGDLVRIAREKGYALGIGHRYRTTFNAYRSFVMSDAAAEVEIVFPSEIAELGNRE